MKDGDGNGLIKKTMTAIKEIEESLNMTWEEALQTFRAAYQLMIATEIIIRTMGNSEE